MDGDARNLLICMTEIPDGYRISLRIRHLPDYLNANQRHYIKRRFKKSFAFSQATQCGTSEEGLAFELTDMSKSQVQKLVHNYLTGIASLLDPPMSQKQVQALLEITREELKRWATDGRLPALRKNTSRQGKGKVNSLTFSRAAMQKLAETPEVIRGFREEDSRKEPRNRSD